MIIEGRTIYLPGADIDTDQIVPARFLKALTFAEMGAHLFYDTRFDSTDTALSHPLNTIAATEARILVVASNFGCGSSREHAPQAIRRFGFQAIIGLSFGDIFSQNSREIGLPCVPVSTNVHQQIVEALTADPSLIAQINLTKNSVSIGPSVWPTTLDRQSQQAFITGRWDIGAVLRANADEVRALANRLPSF